MVQQENQASTIKAGNFLINYKNAFQTYGVFVEKNGLNDLIKVPSFKKLTTTEWLELEGEETDLTNPMLNNKQVKINFCITDTSKAREFFDELRSATYIEYYFWDIGRYATLRLISNDSFSSLLQLGKLSLTFSEDKYTFSITEEKTYTATIKEFYTFDEKEFFAEYGINVLQGTDDNWRKMESIRENLKSDNLNENGIKIDSSVVASKSKDVTFKLLIHANDIEDFWQRWNKFFKVVTSKGIHKLQYIPEEYFFDCYYKSCNVTKFEKSRDKIWCEFNVVFTLTGEKKLPEIVTFSTIMFDDTMSDPKNITNVDDGITPDSEEYVAPYHVQQVWEKMIPLWGKLNKETNVWEGKRISIEDYRLLADGSDFDYTDESGTGRDAMMYCPAFYYKGVNDYRNRKKYMFWGSEDKEPTSTAKKTERIKLSDCLFADQTAIYGNKVKEGVSFIDEVFMKTSQCNTYKVEVSNKRLVRYYSLMTMDMPCVFTDTDGLVLAKIEHNLTYKDAENFDLKNDYLFSEIPENAVYLYFCCEKEVPEDNEVIITDSDNIEALEPDWVRNPEWLLGLYLTGNNSGKVVEVRSVSGRRFEKWNASESKFGWIYDDNGDPIGAENMEVKSSWGTGKDAQNLSRLRGKGYQLQDYEMRKILALIFYALYGTRDNWAIGESSKYLYTTGETNYSGKNNAQSKLLGFEQMLQYKSPYNEILDYICFDTVSWEALYRNQMEIIDESANIDGRIHIYNPIDKTERIAKFGTLISTQPVKYMTHGRFCDIFGRYWANVLYYKSGSFYDGNTNRSNKQQIISAGGGNYSYQTNGIASLYPSKLADYARLAFRGKIKILD